MRILFAAPYKPAWRLGGPAVSVPGVAEALARRGHEVVVFTTTANMNEDLPVVTGRPYEIDGVEVWYFARIEPLQRMLPHVSYLSQSVGMHYSPQMRVALGERVRRVDLVHTHMPFIYPTLAGARAALRHDKPLFYHQRGAFDPLHLRFRSLKKRLYLHWIERPILRRATTLLALTDFEAQCYRRLGVQTPCAIVPNGVNVLPEAPLDVAMLRAQCGLGAEHQVILFMSRLHSSKGGECLLEAFLRIAEGHPHARLVFAGPDESGMQTSLQCRAAAAGLGSRVILPGMVHGELKRNLLQRADLFCLPSAGEGCSNAVLEALAVGTPVLLSPECHFDIVQASGAGRVVARDAAALANALAELLSNVGALREMGRRGRALVAQRYSWDGVAGQLEEVYGEGVERHHARHERYTRIGQHTAPRCTKKLSVIE